MSAREAGVPGLMARSLQVSSLKSQLEEHISLQELVNLAWGCAAFGYTWGASLAETSLSIAGAPQSGPFSAQVGAAGPQPFLLSLYYVRFLSRALGLYTLLHESIMAAKIGILWRMNCTAVHW